jgi:hypothetical protein
MINRLKLPALIKSLNPNELRRRLDQLDGERAALMTLLRAVRARERQSKGSGTTAPNRRSGRPPNRAKP